MGGSGKFREFSISNRSQSQTYMHIIFCMHSLLKWTEYLFAKCKNKNLINKYKTYTYSLILLVAMYIIVWPWESLIDCGDEDGSVIGYPYISRINAAIKVYCMEVIE